MYCASETEWIKNTLKSFTNYIDIDLLCSQGNRNKCILLYHCFSIHTLHRFGKAYCHKQLARQILQRKWDKYNTKRRNSFICCLVCVDRLSRWNQIYPLGEIFGLYYKLKRAIGKNSYDPYVSLMWTLYPPTWPLLCPPRVTIAFSLCLLMSSTFSILIG